jgi:uncharacterized membrane protein YcaP (DUF421 family)
MNLCRYQNIFGVPGKGFHSFRIADIAVFDVLGTLLIAAVISKVFSCNFLISLIITFILGILLHRLFCVRTTVDKLLFKVKNT